MGNLKIDNIDIKTLNGVSPDLFFKYNGYVLGGDIIAQASAKDGMLLVEKPDINSPIDFPNVGFYMCYTSSGIADNSMKYKRIVALDLTSSAIYMTNNDISGSWTKWKSIVNSYTLDTFGAKIRTDMKTADDLKVDKVNGKQLSTEDFTTTYKNAINELINTNYFRGYFDTIVAVKAQTNPKNGWYCICLETKTIWYYNNEWKDLLNTNTGDMKSIFYDADNKRVNVYNRTNHTGKQAISTIEGLEEKLASKTDTTPATVDTLNVDSLSNQYCYMPSSANITGTLPINITNLDYEKQYVFTSTSSDKYIHNRIDSCVDGNSWVRGYAKARGKFEDWEQIITNKVQRLPSNINIDTEFKNYTTNYSGNIVNVSLGTLPAGLTASNNFIMLSGTVVSNTQRQEIKDLNSINTWTRFWNGYKWSDWYLALTERAVK